MNNVDRTFRKTFRASLLAAAASVAFASTAASAYDHQKGGGVLSFRATVQADGSVDHNWLNPANWSAGQVPGPYDDVVLDGEDYVVIDGASTAAARNGNLQIADLSVRDSAVLEVIGGAIVQTRYETVQDRGQVIYRGSGNIGEAAIFGGASDPTAAAPALSEVVVTKFNPTSQSKRTTILKCSFGACAMLDMGLGGTEAAGITKTGTGTMELRAGRGHYSTLITDTLVIEGELRISTYYDYSPQPGDRFQLVTVNGTRSGEFIGLPEGGYVGCTEYNVGLRLSYRGGDGNDLVLSAEQTDPATCLLLPAVQKVREAAARIDKLPGSLGAVVETEGKLPAPTTPISAPPPPKK